MATAVKKAPCSTCGKARGGVKCEGCSKIFCLNHFDGHRQELSKQLDELEVTRDFFRQTLTDKIAEPQKHALTEQINEWEYQSINKIRQAAEEARQILLKYTAGLNTKLEDQLNNLTKQLRQSREENDFYETDIDQWRKELTRMTNELAKPSSITIRQDPTSLVTKITVKISDERHDKNFYQGALLFITCPYCKQNYYRIDRETHKKNCRYNPANCSNNQQLRNNPTSDQNSNRLNYTDQPNDTADIPCEYCCQSIRWDDYRSHMQACVAQHYPRIPEQSRIDGPAAASPCKYCNKLYMTKYLEMHHRNCSQNPDNVASEKEYRTLFPPLLPPSMPFS